MPPSIDARADLYGDEFLRKFNRALLLESPELLPNLLEQYHIGWTLLSPTQPAVALLDRLPGWQRFYTDDVAVVHIRTRRDSGGNALPATPAATQSQFPQH